MGRLSISGAVMVLAALAVVSPARAQIGSCPYYGWTQSIPCGNEQGCIQYYTNYDCWGYGNTGQTCRCPGQVTCCGKQYMASDSLVGCIPGSQCAGCLDLRRNEAAPLVSTSGDRPKPAVVFLPSTGSRAKCSADAAAHPPARRPSSVESERLAQASQRPSKRDRPALVTSTGEQKDSRVQR